MNAAIRVRSRGTRSASSPRSIGGNAVVAPSRTALTVPIVALPTPPRAREALAGDVNGPSEATTSPSRTNGTKAPRTAPAAAPAAPGARRPGRDARGDGDRRQHRGARDPHRPRRERRGHRHHRHAEQADDLRAGVEPVDAARRVADGPPRWAWAPAHRPQPSRQGRAARGAAPTRCRTRSRRRRACRRSRRRRSRRARSRCRGRRSRGSASRPGPRARPGVDEALVGRDLLQPVRVRRRVRRRRGRQADGQRPARARRRRCVGMRLTTPPPRRAPAGGAGSQRAEPAPSIRSGGVARMAATAATVIDRLADADQRVDAEHRRQHGARAARCPRCRARASTPVAPSITDGPRADAGHGQERGAGAGQQVPGGDHREPDRRARRRRPC